MKSQCLVSLRPGSIDFLHHVLCRLVRVLWVVLGLSNLALQSPILVKIKLASKELSVARWNPPFAGGFPVGSSQLLSSVMILPPPHYESTGHKSDSQVVHYVHISAKVFVL